MSKRELLFSVTKRDLHIETFRSGGPGGQHQNKRDTGVRITHGESGAVGEARDRRSQHQNRVAAFKRMVDSSEFQVWVTKRAAEVVMSKEDQRRREADVKRVVYRQLRPEFLRIDVLVGGEWVEAK